MCAGLYTFICMYAVLYMRISSQALVDDDCLLDMKNVFGENALLLAGVRGSLMN